MPRVELPSGAWCELRDPATVTNKQRRNVMLAFERTDGGDIEKGLSVIDAMVVLLVESWSFDKPIPSEDPAVLDDMPAKDYDALSTPAAAAMADLFPDFSANGHADPKVPTANSSD